jgi:cytochrome c oxidase cbb3-type subunit 3
MRTPGIVLLAPALASLLAAASCSKGRAQREWTASDHDRLEDTPAQSPGAPRPPSPVTAVAGQPGAPSVGAEVEALWSRSCASCHGPGGKGDGPAGRAVRAANLADPAWQKKVTDAEIAATIAKGRGAMPAFDLNPAALQGLVSKIRSLR